MSLSEINNWMTPEEALSRFNCAEMTLLDLNIPSTAESVIRYGFRFDNFGFLIGEAISSEVFNDYKIFPMPNCAVWLAGLANIRGNLIPVYDLVQLFGLEVENTDYKHLLVIDQGASSIGVLIHRLPLSLNVIDWKPVSHKAKLSSKVGEYIKTTYSVDNVLWMDIDHHNFFKSIKDDVAL